jgi:nucleotide-binding universal stress UspA family protein
MPKDHGWGTSSLGPAQKTAPESRSPVLLTLGATSWSFSALIRAYVFANRFDAPLLVLRAVPPYERRNSVLVRNDSADADSLLHTLSDLADRTWRWCNRVLPFPIASSNVMVRKGEFGATAANVAKAVGARLVVVPDSEIRRGGDVVAIVDSTVVPVLVSRNARAGDGIVVATDLSDERFPVLRQGVEIAAALDADVAFVHNVRPSSSRPYMTFLPAWVSKDRVRERLAIHMERRLKRLAGELGDGIDSDVVSEADTADAIVDAAWRRQADVVVVGSRPRSKFVDLFNERVACAVVERTARSVMVVPFDRRQVR